MDQCPNCGAGGQTMRFCRSCGTVLPAPQPPDQQEGVDSGRVDETVVRSRSAGPAEFPSAVDPMAIPRPRWGRANWLFAGLAAVVVIGVATTTVLLTFSNSSSEVSVPAARPGATSTPTAAASSDRLSASGTPVAAMPPTGSEAESAGVEPGPVSSAAEAAVSAADPAAGEVQSAQDPATEVINVAAVDRAGNLSAGFSISSAPVADAFGCGAPSPAAVGDDIQYCGPTSASADVCWALPDRINLLCGDNPWSTTLRKVRGEKASTATSPLADPAPWGLELADGAKCRLRNGGSWDGRADLLTGAYSCDREDEFVLSSSDAAVIDRSGPLWTVLVGDLSYEKADPPVTTHVVKAYFADRAADGSEPSTAPAAAPGQIVEVESFRAYSWSKGGSLNSTSDSMVSFTSPSGNIHCKISASDSPIATLCQIEVADYAPAADPGDCMQSWETDLVALGSAGAVSGVCLGGVEVPAASAVLPYGSSISYGGYVCGSAGTGMRCTTSSSGQGFTVSRQAVTIF